ncbi:threonine synthase-like 2 isoform X1 [Esox lucius]|uniref:Threonine synthase-like 2 n=1 Tax=Esox lucius TaxID=8010 RepID=A0A6Q2XKG1_ESOLU|nr:threonine synthase-like 2 isoform X1 [Esox lucius]
MLVMWYCSTRGGVQGWGFQEVLFSGYAPDGGMFMPETLPTLTPDTLRSWRSLSYPQLVISVCSVFIPTEVIPLADLEDLVNTALSGFSVPGAVSLAKLKQGLNVLELFHGKTMAFKDLAMTCTVHFLNYFLHKDSLRAIVVVGTSGDTGGSAIQSAKGLSGLDLVVVYPRGRITPVQEKQMTTCLEDNIHVFAADGSSDDVDVPIRRLFSDQELVKRHRLMSLNSVNWSRVMVQLAHFIYAYLHVSGLEEAEIAAPLPVLEIIVPTGGAGNIAAGCIVKQMGIPLCLVAMTNANDIVPRTVKSGDFSMATNVTQTLAPAIDIQDPYNMERVFWLLSGRDGGLVKRMMEEFQNLHRHTLPKALHKQLSQALTSGAVGDQEIVETMQRCWKENQYLLCPHTAVAVWHHYHCSPTAGVNRCCLATASPSKFQAAVQKAGLTLDLPEKVLALDKKQTRYVALDRSENWEKDWEGRLKQCIQAIGSARQHGLSYYEHE